MAATVQFAPSPKVLRAAAPFSRLLVICICVNVECTSLRGNALDEPGLQFAAIGLRISIVHVPASDFIVQRLSTAPYGGLLNRTWRELIHALECEKPSLARNETPRRVVRQGADFALLLAKSDEGQRSGGAPDGMVRFPHPT